jgi:hypothetical protein
MEAPFWDIGRAWRAKGLVWSCDAEPRNACSVLLSVLNKARRGLTLLRFILPHARAHYPSHYHHAYGHTQYTRYERTPAGLCACRASRRERAAAAAACSPPTPQEGQRTTARATETPQEHHAPAGIVDADE